MDERDEQSTTPTYVEPDARKTRHSLRPQTTSVMREYLDTVERIAHRHLPWCPKCAILTDAIGHVTRLHRLELREAPDAKEETSTT